MSDINEQYNHARSLIKAKQFAEAQEVLQQLMASKSGYKSARYYAGRAAFALKGYEKAGQLFAGFVRQKPTPKVNIANAYSYLARLAILDEDSDSARKLLQRAASHGLVNDRLEKIQAQIWQLENEFGDDEPVLNSRMNVRLDRLASNGTPIVTTTEKGYQSASIFVDKLSYDQIQMLTDK